MNSELNNKLLELCQVKEKESKLIADIAVERLINKGADVNAVLRDDDEELSALVVALVNDNPEIAKVLIENGADVNNTGTDIVDDYQSWEFRSGHGKVPRKRCGIIYYNPVFLASRKGYFDVLKLLIEHGARYETNNSLGSRKPDTYSCYGDPFMSPINSAACNGYYDVVKLLYEKFPKSRDSFSLLNRAVEGGNAEIVKYLLEKGVKSIYNPPSYKYTSTLAYAANVSNVEVVKVLLESGLKADDIGDQLPEENPHATTPLMMAIHAGKFDIVKLLVDNGADINAKDYHGYTPIEYAALCRDAGMINYLLETAKIQGKDILTEEETENLVQMIDHPIQLTGFTYNRNEGSVWFGAKENDIAKQAIKDSKQVLKNHGIVLKDEESHTL